MQNKQVSPLRYARDDWPPLGRTVLLGLQWAAIVIPSIIILGHVIASLEFAEPASQSASQTPYLQKLFMVTAVTLAIQVLWGHRLPLIAGPATVLLIGVIASQGFSVGDIYTSILIGGVDMTMDRERRLIWASVWPLEEGVAIEVEMFFQDADAALIAPLRTTATTSTMRLELDRGQQVLVSPHGDDAGPGTEIAPYRTIARAARDRRPGDVVHVLPGRYTESLKWGPELRGSVGQPIVFTGEDAVHPVLDSSVAIPKGVTWDEEGDGVYSYPASGQSQLVTQDDRRMFGYRSLADLRHSAIAPNRAFFDGQRPRTR